MELAKVNRVKLIDFVELSRLCSQYLIFETKIPPFDENEFQRIRIHAERLIDKKLEWKWKQVSIPFDREYYDLQSELHILKNQGKYI